MIYNTLGNGQVETYDGKIKNIITKKVLGTFTKDYKQLHIWVRKESGVRNGIEEYYEQFIKDANTLKETTNGEINLFKTGTDYNTALSLFNKFTKTIFPELINQDEA